MKANTNVKVAILVTLIFCIAVASFLVYKRYENKKFIDQTVTENNTREEKKKQQMIALDNLRKQMEVASNLTSEEKAEKAEKQKISLDQMRKEIAKENTMTEEQKTEKTKKQKEALDAMRQKLLESQTSGINRINKLSNTNYL